MKQILLPLSLIVLERWGWSLADIPGNVEKGIPKRVETLIKTVNRQIQLPYVWPSLLEQYAQNVHCRVRERSIANGEKSSNSSESSGAYPTCPQYEDLVRYLLQRANHTAMPDTLTTIKIGISIELFKITSLDLDKGIMRTASRLRLFWQDERLAYRGDVWFPNWNSAVDYVVVPGGPWGVQNVWVSQHTHTRHTLTHLYPHSTRVSYPLGAWRITGKNMVLSSCDQGYMTRVS